MKKFICIILILSIATMPSASMAQAQSVPGLPLPGTFVSLSQSFAPAIFRGLKVSPENPFSFDFILDKGDYGSVSGLEEESEKLIKYFLASLTVPEENLWVNLSPDEPDRIIPGTFGQTEMGQDLLAQDYILKQLTASLMYPEDDLGQTFWDEVYSRVYEQHGITDVPVNTFNKIWIVPEKATAYENKDRAFITEAKLKVMLEEEYLVNRNDKALTAHDKPDRVASEVLREVLIPVIEHEVNTGAHFSQLRQIYYSHILATWFKRNLKNAFLNKVYSDQNKTDGIITKDTDIKNKIYAQYLEAFRQGAYDYIKEEYDPTTQQVLPRKYFSGGSALALSDEALLVTKEFNMANETGKNMVQVMATLTPSGVQAQAEDIALLSDKVNAVAQEAMENEQSNVFVRHRALVEATKIVINIREEFDHVDLKEHIRNLERLKHMAPLVGLNLSSMIFEEVTKIVTKISEEFDGMSAYDRSISLKGLRNMITAAEPELSNMIFEIVIKGLKIKDNQNTSNKNVSKAVIATAEALHEAGLITLDPETITAMTEGYVEWMIPNYIDNELPLAALNRIDLLARLGLLTKNPRAVSHAIRIVEAGVKRRDYYKKFKRNDLIVDDTVFHAAIKTADTLQKAGIFSELDTTTVTTMTQEYTEWMKTSGQMEVHRGSLAMIGILGRSGLLNENPAALAHAVDVVEAGLEDKDDTVFETAARTIQILQTLDAQITFDPDTVIVTTQEYVNEMSAPKSVESRQSVIRRIGILASSGALTENHEASINAVRVVEAGFGWGSQGLFDTSFKVASDAVHALSQAGVNITLDPDDVEAKRKKYGEWLRDKDWVVRKAGSAMLDIISEHPRPRTESSTTPAPPIENAKPQLKDENDDTLRLIAKIAEELQKAGVTTNKDAAIAMINGYVQRMNDQERWENRRGYVVTTCILVRSGVLRENPEVFANAIRIVELGIWDKEPRVVAATVQSLIPDASQDPIKNYEQGLGELFHKMDWKNQLATLKKSDVDTEKEFKAMLLLDIGRIGVGVSVPPGCIFYLDQLISQAKDPGLIQAMLDIMTFWSHQGSMEAQQALEKRIINIVKRINGSTGDSAVPSLSSEEQAALRAVINSPRLITLIPLLASDQMPFEERVVIGRALAEHGDIDGEYLKIRDSEWHRCLAVIPQVYKSFEMIAPKIMVDYINQGRVTIDSLRQYRPQVVGKTLPELLDIFEAEGKNDERLLTYYLFNLPDLNYTYPFPFDRFKAIIEKALYFRKKNNKEAEDYLSVLIRENNPRFANEIIQAFQTGAVILPKDSGLIDADGNPIPQAVSTQFDESEALKGIRGNFVEEFNKRFILWVRVLALLQNCHGILKQYDSQALHGEFGQMVGQLESTSGLEKTLKALEEFHPKVLQLLPKYAQSHTEELKKQSDAENIRFLTQLTKKYFNQIPAFQDIFRQRKIDPDDEILETLNPEDFDTLYHAFEKRSEKYQSVDTFETYIDMILREILEGLRFSEERTGLNQAVYDRITNEMMRHFGVVAQSFAQASSLRSGKGHQHTAYVSLLAKKDLIKFIRFADGSQCCLSSNNKNLESTHISIMGHALVDKGIQVFLIHTKDKPIGFVLWHFGYGKDNTLKMPTFKLYLATEYQSDVTTQNIWRKIEDIVPWIGIRQIAQSSKGSGLAQPPPSDYAQEFQVLAKIQTVTEPPKMGAGPFVAVVLDLADLKVNEMMESPIELAVKDIPALDVAMLTSGGKVDLNAEAEVQAALDAAAPEAIFMNINGYSAPIIGKLRTLGLWQDDSSEGSFNHFLDQTEIRFHIMRPDDFNTPKLGLSVPFTQPEYENRDVVAVYKYETKGNLLHVYFSTNTYKMASKAAILEMVGIGLYSAYANSRTDIPDADLDLEARINGEFEGFQNFVATLSDAEREDLGFNNPNQDDPYIRAHLFGRLIGEAAEQGQGSVYGEYLRFVHRSFRSMEERIKDLNLPQPSADRNTHLWDLWTALLEHTGNTPASFAGEQLENHDTILWNYATFSRPVLRTMTAALEELIQSNQVTQIALPVGIDHQAELDRFLQTGEITDALRGIIANQLFPEEIPDGEKFVDIWGRFLRFVYRSNELNKDQAVRLLAHASLTQDDQTAQRRIWDTIEDQGDKTVIVQYCQSFADQQDWARDEKIYRLIHVDPDLGFVNDRITNFSYVLNHSLTGQSDFALPVLDIFAGNAILMMADDDWQEAAIASLRAASSAPVRAGPIKAWFNRIAGQVDQYHHYQGVVVSRLGDDGGDDGFAQEPDLAPDRDQMAPVPAGVGGDDAMMAAPGGIDLNPQGLEIKTKGEGIDFAPDFDPAMLAPGEAVGLNADTFTGFTPVIINIIPITNLYQFLGVRKKEKESSLTRLYRK